MKWYKHLAFALVITISLAVFPVTWPSKRSLTTTRLYRRDTDSSIELIANVTTILGNVIPISAGCTWFVTWFRNRRKEEDVDD